MQTGLLWPHAGQITEPYFSCRCPPVRCLYQLPNSKPSPDSSSTSLPAHPASYKAHSGPRAFALALCSLVPSIKFPKLCPAQASHLSTLCWTAFSQVLIHNIFIQSHSQQFLYVLLNFPGGLYRCLKLYYLGSLCSLPPPFSLRGKL